MVALVAGVVLGLAPQTAVAATPGSDTVALSDWMGSLPGVADTPLSELPIPGTHDSATSSLTADSPWSEAGRADFGDAALAFIPKAAAAAWSRAQPDSVGAQLRAGIRYLDLRLTQEPDQDVYLEHGLRGPALTPVLTEIGDFARAHPREAVIVGLDRFSAFDDRGYGRVRDAVRAAFGDRLAPAALGAEVTLRQLWSAQRNVLLVDTSGRLRRSRGLRR